jgi:hypothetical protein
MLTVVEMINVVIMDAHIFVFYQKVEIEVAQLLPLRELYFLMSPILLVIEVTRLKKQKSPQFLELM